MSLATIQNTITNGLANLSAEDLFEEKQISKESFIRTAAIAISQSKDLGEAQTDSVIMALMKCAEDGLMPDGKEAAILTFNTKDSNGGWIKKAQYLPMVDGVLKLARTSGEVTSIAAKVVYQSDQFDYWVDEHGEHLQHRPAFENRGDLRLVYAMARLKSGDLLIEVMTLDEVMKVKNASKSSKSGPWVDWFDRMALKAVIHRIAKRLPKASELMKVAQTGMDIQFSNQEKDITPQDQPRAALPAYPQDRFEQMLPKWKQLIAKGATPDAVIAKASTKGELSNDQIKQIRGQETEQAA